MKKKILSILITILAVCTLMFTMTACGEPPHTHTFDQQVVNDTFKATNATCEDKATYYYSCICGEKGTETFESGEALGHSFTNYTYNEDAKCEEDGTETAVCNNGCGQRYTRTKEGSALEHSYTNYVYNNDAKCEINGTETAICNNGCGEEDTREKLNTKLGHNYSNWVSNNNGTHTKTCANDSSHKITENCNGGTATCQEKAICIDCGAFYGTIGNHNADTEWTQTETHHYHVCLINGCTEKLDKEKHTFDKNKKCTVCDYVTTALMGTEINSDIYEIDGTNLFVKVPNGQSYFNFAETIEVADGATYKVYTDIGCREIDCIPSYAVNNLSIENNTYYILVTNAGCFPKTYTVTVRRRPMYDVTFNTDGGTSVQKQIVEEDSFVPEPTTIKTGYTFTGWDFDFSNPITSNTTITASWTAKTNTPYKVEYYLENLDNDKYTLTQTVNKTGTSDTTANAELKTFAHFTHKESSTDSGNINANGTTVLKVYYTRNVYTLSIDDTSIGSITNVGSYKYGTRPFISTATPLPIGYDFGWYSGENLLSNDPTYTFTVTQNVVAKFMLKQEMVNFNFSSTLTTCKITGIKDKSVSEIIVPNYVTEIATGAFSSCSNLESITVPFIGSSQAASSGYDQVLGYIFGYATSSSESISGAIYQYSSNSTYYHYYIPSSLKSVVLTNGDIPCNAFYNCSSLTSVEIPNSVRSIGNNAFYDCSSLTKVDYTGTIDEWVQISFNGAYANPLYYAKNLYINDQLVTEVNIATVTKINSYAFTSFDGLTSVTIGDSVEDLGDYAFYGCSNLTSVTIGNSVTSIGSYAFSVCKSLTSVIIPDSVTSIGSYAFYGCSNLTSVTIGNSVTSIGGHAFYNCSSLTSIVIPDSVTSIGSYAFAGCDSLTSVTIGDNVTSIGDYAFYDCRNITNVILGDSVESIGVGVFYGYSDYNYTNDIRSITIPKSVKSIGYSAFGGCHWLTSVIYTGTMDEWVEIEFGNARSNPLFFAKNLYINDQLATEAKITTAIKINSYAFFNSTSLTSVVISDSVISIGADAFYNCSQLTSIVIPNSVTSIGNYAFYGCTSLTSIDIPNSVTSIGSYAFEYCSILTNVNYTGTIDGWVQIEFGGYYANPIYYAKNLYINDQLVTEANITSATKISAYAFYNCDSLTSVTIGDSVTSIGEDAFRNCNSLTSVTIGDNVTSIPGYAFYNCSNLTSVTIGSSVTSIGYYAFYSCDGLTSVTFNDITGWYVTSNKVNWEKKRYGTSTYVKDLSTNATYFKSTYYNYYWYKL